ncbi:WD repeat-containing protein 6 [Cymbomonas tetramitiformis]|uniref:WD repeat-containing protein 6 n=1 Tax=Cymbomonas tetramitiformis TaxID=36881 RepID=A0AAE0BU18_9CHLO|nr:WD repeat-containing protein 6 [Cymbomonas tetramitiformis]
MASTGALQKRAYVGDVTALRLLPNTSEQGNPCKLLLAGIGAQLHCYALSTGELCLAEHVLEGARVHGINARAQRALTTEESVKSKYLIAIHGDRIAKVYSLEVVDVAQGSCRLKQVFALGPFRHWVLDVRLLGQAERSEDPGATPQGSKDEPELDLVAVGLTNNSVQIWNWRTQCKCFEVESEEHSLLYSMALSGTAIDDLLVAAGTIFQGVVVYGMPGEEARRRQPDGGALRAPTLHRLLGHEGSVHRVVWDAAGRRIASCSDDRTVRVWQVHGNDDHVASAPSMIDLEADSVIYGHTARLWDCYLHEDILLTASEDCTCRVWRLDGTCLASFQGHQGRGVWRCEYDVAANILISGGADSSIKLWSLPSLPSAPEDRGCIAGGAGASAAASLRGDVEELTLTPPGCEAGLMDSKSEYVRAVALLSTSELAVATNRGLLHYVSIDKGGDVVWQQLWENPKGGPLMCMSVQQDPEYRCGGNLCGRRASTYSLLLGDAKGHVAALRLEDVEEGAEAVPRRMRAHDLAVWVAHDTRRVLDAFWGERGRLGDWELFTADPVGQLRWWRLPAIGVGSAEEDPSLLGVFGSPFRTRVLSVHLRRESGLLAAGDASGNLVLFRVPAGSAAAPDSAQVHETEPVAQVRCAHGGAKKARAHGNTAVPVVHVMPGAHPEAGTVRTGGRDGQLHTFEAERCEGEDGAVSWQLRRSGTQQAGGIVSVQLEQHTASGEHLIAGFQADDLMVWSCTHQREVLRVNCGGWKRPHALLLGPNPASQACFAFVRDRQVRVWRSWEWAAMRGGDEGGAVKAPPASIHMCFHGREVNAVEILPPPPRRHLTAVGSPEVITGGEDGQLMRTPYTGEGTVEERSGHTHRAEGDVRGAVGAKLAVQAAQKVGEHCSGTAVRQVALAPAGGEGRAWVLATVGAKEALMLWGLTWGEAAPEAGGEAAPVAGRGGQLRSQMLSERARPAHLGHRTWRQEGGAAEGPGALESDQRYLAVKCFCRGDWDSGNLLCYVITASSDAALTLQVYSTVSQTWQTLAVLVHHTKPVLSLSLLDEEASSEPSMYSRLDEEASSEPLMAQDAAAIPKCLDRRCVVLFSGSTDGQIAVWDLSATVADSAASVVKGGTWRCATLTPAQTLTQAHQSGVNAMHCAAIAPGPQPTKEAQEHEKQADRTEDGEGCRSTGCAKAHGPQSETSRQIDVVLVSGGDDQAIRVTSWGLQRGPPHGGGEVRAMIAEEERTPSSSADVVTVTLLSTLMSPLAHFSALRGIWTDGDFVMSTGLDQRLQIWRLSATAGQAGGGDTEMQDAVPIQLVWLQKCMLEVLEPSDLCVYQDSGSSSQEYTIAIVGRGMQIVSWKPFKMDLS